MKVVGAIQDEVDVGDLVLNRLGRQEKVRVVAVPHRHVGLEPEAEGVPVFLLSVEGLGRWQLEVLFRHCSGSSSLRRSGGA